MPLQWLKTDNIYESETWNQQFPNDQNNPLDASRYRNDSKCSAIIWTFPKMLLLIKNPVNVWQSESLKPSPNSQIFNLFKAHPLESFPIHFLFYLFDFAE